MKTLLLAAIGGALLAAPATAQAAPQPDRTQIVSFADLDLRSEAGRSALDRRIRSAVETACGTASSADPKGLTEVRRCREDALQRANAQRERAVSLAAGTGRTALTSR